LSFHGSVLLVFYVFFISQGKPGGRKFELLLA